MKAFVEPGWAGKTQPQHNDHWGSQGDIPPNNDTPKPMRRLITYHTVNRQVDSFIGRNQLGWMTCMHKEVAAKCCMAQRCTCAGMRHMQDGVGCVQEGNGYRQALGEGRDLACSAEAWRSTEASSLRSASCCLCCSTRA